MNIDSVNFGEAVLFLGGNMSLSMANNTVDRWYFTKDQLDVTPSRKAGYEGFKELSYRQQTANFVQDMGQRLKVTQLCINTAIVYMHRFYVFHSFSCFPWYQMAAAALFLATKVEEQPRKLEYVIRVANMCRDKRDTSIDITSDRYIGQSQDLVFNEHVLLQTLGFDVAIDHPHAHVVRCCHLVRASKDLAQSSYLLASNSLHLTTMCLQYKPTVVACFCIHLACKWSNWEIPLSTEKKEWFLYVDSTVTAQLLQQLTDEFLTIFESCPSRLKEKIMSIGDNGLHSCPPAITHSPFDTDPKKIISADQKDGHPHRSHDGKTGSEDLHKHRSSRPHDSSSQQQREREYREKKEREKLAAAQQHAASKTVVPPGGGPVKHSSSHGGHHRPTSVDPNKLKMSHSRPPASTTTSSSSSGSSSQSLSVQHLPNRSEPRDILREAARDSPFGIATKDYNQTHKNEMTKDVPKLQTRDYLLKPSAAAGVAPNKVPMKHEQVRRHDDPKFVKPDNSDIKRHSVHGYNNMTTKTTNTTSQQQQQQKVGAEQSKSVPKQSHVGGGAAAEMKHNHNGSIIPVKEEMISKEEQPVVKRSLFSPEKSPEEKKPTPPSLLIKSEQAFSFPPLSPLPSPPPPEKRRVRNYSSGSEPELRPVMKKIDQVEGFENLMRDSTIGINKLHQVPDIITPINDVAGNEEEPTLSFSKEMRPPDIIPPLSTESMVAPVVINGGIETNPMLISNLLKETPPIISHLPAGKQEEVAMIQNIVKEPKEHHHKSKKKNKEKHKHKDKDRNREDKEKKKKHKDKDREKHKHKEKQQHESTEPGEPIKIKIQKDKIQEKIPIKIKIPKDVIKTEESSLGGGVPPPPPPIGLKIKIPRDIINNCDVEKGGRKREREKDKGKSISPPAKMARGTPAPKESKQNGRHSYNKVTQLGDGDASVRLAESKYIKNSSQ